LSDGDFSFAKHISIDTFKTCFSAFTPYVRMSDENFIQTKTDF